MIEDIQYPILGYAPGSYMCNCCECKKQFFGDKRAVQCELCALRHAYGSLQKKVEWIPVLERLPEINTSVLTWEKREHKKQFEISVGHIDDKNQWWTNSYLCEDEEFYVTHWMHLHSPPGNQH